MEHLERRIELEEEALAGAVKVIGDVQRTGGERPKHIIVRVLDDDEDRALQLVHLPVERVQREAVQRRAKHQRPRVAFGARRQMTA